MGLKLRNLLKIRRNREERSSGGMVLTVTEDTPADMLAGSMELLVQLPRDQNVHTQRVTVPRSTPMMDLLVQIATAHKLSASSYTLQAIGEQGLVLPHQPNTPIGALDALQVKLLPKQGTFIPKRTKQANQPFETTFRLQVLLPRNQLYVSRVSPKMNLGKILEEVCREKNLDKNKYELRHPANLEERLDLSLSLQDYHLQEVTLYAKQGRTLGAALSSQDIMALQRQEERRRQQAKQSVFGFMFRKSKESSLSIDSLGERSVSPARSDETGRSVSPLAPPPRPQRKRRPAPKPPVRTSITSENESKDKLVISHSRNSSDSSGYHEASVLSDNPDSARIPETLPRRSKPPCKTETPRKLAHTSQASKSLGNIALASEGLSHATSTTSISSTGTKKKRAAPPPPIARPLSSAISSQALERIVDSEESLTSDIDISKSPSDIATSSKANSDIGVGSKANSEIGVNSLGSKPSSEIGYKIDAEFRAALADHEEPDNDVQSVSRLKPSTDVLDNVSMPEVKPVAALEKNESVEIPRVAKRGKLVRSPGSIENNAFAYSFVSKNTLENIVEVAEATRKGARETPRKFLPERDENYSKSDLEVPKSKSPVGATIAKDSRIFRSDGKPMSSSLRENLDPGLSSDGGKYSSKERRDWKSQRCLEKLERIVSTFDDGAKNPPICGVLEARYSPSRPHCDNYICDERCRTRMLKHSLSFQSRGTESDAKLLGYRESSKILLTSSRSFSREKKASRASDFDLRRGDNVLAPKLGHFATTNYYDDPRVSSRDYVGDCQTGLEDHFSPPPLSNLQIFAISTKPVDIQVTPEVAIPSEIDKLPSLPIIAKSCSKSSFEKKLSILEPPPPGLVSRQESNENWNQFLVQLNSILETRVESRPVAPTPKPRSFVREASIASLSSCNKVLEEESEDTRRDDDSRASTRNNHEDRNDEKLERETSKSSERTVELREKKVHDGDVKTKKSETNKSETNEGNSVEKRALKHVKSSDDLYGLSLEFPEEIDERRDSTSSGSRSSCAVISTIPKCSRLTASENESNVDGGKISTESEKSNVVESIASTTRRLKIFRSQSALDDFERNPFEKKPRHKTSNYEDFNCALNPNVSRSAIEPDRDEDVFLDDIYVTRTLVPTNSRCWDSQVVENEDNWEPQLIEDSGISDRPTETDILLQKVSDTLSNSLPTSKLYQPKEVVETLEKMSKGNEPGKVQEDPVKVSEKKEWSPRIERKSNEEIAKASQVVSADVTLNSQQDTSDYVSATGDDLSITDWEYHLPAPPSAFRDNVSSDYDGYDTITLRSVEAFKDPSTETPERTSNASSHQSPIFSSKEVARVAEKLPNSTSEIQESKRLEVEQEKPKLSSRGSLESVAASVNSELKREMISELSTKIGNGSLPQSSGKVELDCRRSSSDSKASKIAPVDNTLSNFTITTYSRQKSLNIFGETSPVEEKRDSLKFPNSSQARVSATSRTDRANTLNGNDNVYSRDKFSERAQSAERERNVNFANGESFFSAQHNSLQRHSSLGKEQEKSTNVYRSKSHITLAENSKYRADVEAEKSSECCWKIKTDDPSILKSTSVTNLNQDAPRSNVKFSQWRENMLKRQEEPSTEKQLQSLQVLKNILPQLKGSQQAEEDVPDTSSKKDNNHHTPGSKGSVEAKSIETEERVSVEEPRRSESETAKSQKPAEDGTTKRYKYTGPPAISLGSWSERPRINVQLKMDQDYKFATGSSTSGAKTCVNLNGASKETPLPRKVPKTVSSNGSASHEDPAVRREPNQQLSNQSTTTPATGFKKPTLLRTVVPEVKEVSRNDDKPIVTSVALKKIHIGKVEAKEPEDDVKIDTKPVNFRELSKTFGQEVCLRAKPKRVPQSRHSDYYGGKPDILQNLSNVNGHANVWENANKNALKHADSMKINVSNGYQIGSSHGTVRRYTSVVGIQAQNNNNYGTENGETVPKSFTSSTKIGSLMPVVKGFKISTSNNGARVADEPRENGISGEDSTKKMSNVPPPPTMPIITGVTLKNSTARPKSMPVCSIDPRDQLLESIRNFGGRDRLKSVQS